MSEEIKKIGTVFKTKRKELNLSLKEVENATSIRMKHLQAIEEGKEDDFLSPVYLLGFMRQYANFLGIDGEKILQEYPDIYNRRAKKQEFSYGIGTLDVRNSTGGKGKWFPSAIWSVMIVVMIASAYYLAKYLGII